MEHNRDVTEDPGTALPSADFPEAGRLHEGYSRDEVDRFVADLVRALDRDPPTMAPYEVEDIRFHITRHGGYAMEPVDEYLEEAQALLRERHGGDAVASLQGHLVDRKPASTTWIYVVAFVIVAAVVAFLVAVL